MQIELPDIETHARIDIEGGRRPMDDDEFFEFCMKNQELRIERDANGEIIIMPPCGYDTEDSNVEIVHQLRTWAKADGRGNATGSGTLFFLANKAARGPDAAWIPMSRLKKLSERETTKFLHVCPDFVVELVSPSDRLKKVKAKMEEWIANGAVLGWLIHPNRRTIYVYRPGKEPEELVGVDHIDGEGPVKGFRLELGQIWKVR